VAHSGLEVADIFRAHGHAWRVAQRGHLSLGQLKVMSAIEHCRSAALGGHVLRCEGCGTDQVSYNSCRNRHCPKCQSSAARRWLDARQADLLPVEYYHVVFTLPAPIADLAYQNKAPIYGLLFDMAAEVLLTIAADPKHLGARIGATLVLHTWGSALTHHPHVHGIVPGGGLAPDGKTWIACRPGFFLPVRVLSRLFRRRFLEGLQQLHRTGQLQFFGEHAALQDAKVFADWLAPMRRCEWVVYAKRPFAGPQAVLAYLSRYTHRVAISNSRLVALDARGVSFRWKDYRASGAEAREPCGASTAKSLLWLLRQSNCFGVLRAGPAPTRLALRWPTQVLAHQPQRSSAGRWNSCQMPLRMPKPTARPRPRIQLKYHMACVCPVACQVSIQVGVRAHLARGHRASHDVERPRGVPQNDRQEHDRHEQHDAEGRRA